jgi:hypothetical protein
MEHEFVEVRERLAVLETKMDATDRELGVIISKLDSISSLVQRGQGASWLAKVVAHGITVVLSSLATVWATLSGGFKIN